MGLPVVRQLITASLISLATAQKATTPEAMARLWEAKKATLKIKAPYSAWFALSGGSWGRFMGYLAFAYFSGFSAKAA